MTIETYEITMQENVTPRIYVYCGDADFVSVDIKTITSVSGFPSWTLSIEGALCQCGSTVAFEPAKEITSEDFYDLDIRDWGPYDYLVFFCSAGSNADQIEITVNTTKFGYLV
jgi:hypothetical protein